MSMLREVWTGGRNIFRHKGADRELDQELRSYLDMLVEENLRAGLNLKEARRQAMRDIGGMEQVKERVREARMGNRFENLLRDLRFGIRMLIKSPGVTTVAVLSLALGIGGNAAMFSLVSNTLLRPLPYPEPGRLIHITDYYPKGAVAALQQRSKSFEVAGYSTDSQFNMTGTGEAVQLAGSSVSANLFSLLGASAEIGRTFQEGEDRPGRDRVVILSHSLWKSKFGGDPAVLGRPVSIDGVTREVVGVAPPDFGFPSSSVQMWVPITLDSTNEADFWGYGYMPLVGRLRQGATIAQAQPELRSMIPDVIKLFPFAMPVSWNADAAVTGLQESLVSDIRLKLIVLLCAVALILLIACTNVASLLLAKTASRQKEIAIRAALGAGRWQIMRQLLTESVLLALTGAALGLVLAQSALSIFKSVLPSDNLRLADAGIDWPVLVFVTVVAVFSGLVFGLAPALSASRLHLAQSIRTRGQSSAGGAGLRLRNVLIAGEVALAVVLVIGAGLLTKSLWLLTRVNPGFSPQGVLAVRVYPREGSCRDKTACLALYDELLRRAGRLGGVSEVAAASTTPLSHEVPALPVELQDHTLRVGVDLEPMLWAGAVTPDYFHLMRIPVLEGRTFTAGDSEKSEMVAVVSAATAKRYWPGQSPIGKHIKVTWDEQARTVVGMVGDVRQYDLANTSPEGIQGEFYMPYPQSVALNRQLPTAMTLILRTSGNAPGLASEIRGLVADVNPDVPVSEAQPMESVVSASISGSRSLMWLFVSFAGCALILAAIGVYGIISYSTSQRMSELGLRLALGATNRGLFGLVLGQSIRLVALGLAAGILASISLTRMLTAFLFGVTATDPVTFMAVSGLLIGTAVLAGYLPARRAAGTDPLTALRVD
jgi:predicted permease